MIKLEYCFNLFGKDKA